VPPVAGTTTITSVVGTSAAVLRRDTERLVSIVLFSLQTRNDVKALFVTRHSVSESKEPETAKGYNRTLHKKLPWLKKILRTMSRGIFLFHDKWLDVSR
jgi:hypothetical protein